MADWIDWALEKVERLPVIGARAAAIRDQRYEPPEFRSAKAWVTPTETKPPVTNDNLVDPRYTDTARQTRSDRFMVWAAAPETPASQIAHHLGKAATWRNRAHAYDPYNSEEKAVAQAYLGRAREIRTSAAATSGLTQADRDAARQMVTALPQVASQRQAAQQQQLQPQMRPTA